MVARRIHTLGVTACAMRDVRVACEASSLLARTRSPRSARPKVVRRLAVACSVHSAACRRPPRWLLHFLPIAHGAMRGRSCGGSNKARDHQDLSIYASRWCGWRCQGALSLMHLKLDDALLCFTQSGDELAGGEMERGPISPTAGGGAAGGGVSAPAALRDEVSTDSRR